MISRIISADPDQLERYGRQAEALDRQLLPDSIHLRQRLTPYTMNCLDYAVPVADEPEALSALGREGLEMDEWVERVARAFRLAGEAPWLRRFTIWNGFSRWWWLIVLQWSGHDLVLRTEQILNDPVRGPLYLRFLKLGLPIWLFDIFFRWYSPETPQDAVLEPQAPKESGFGKLLKAAQEGMQNRLDELAARYPAGMKPVSSVVTSPENWRPVEAEVNSIPGARHKAIYEAVINQFGVDTNTRYQKYVQNGITKTCCNKYVWDVTKAMGAEIPHWTDSEGHADPSGTNELNVSKIRAWLRGPANTQWHRLSAEEAQTRANEGKPVIVLDGGSHIGMVRPGQVDENLGPALAQAGAACFSNKHVLDGFGSVTSDWTTLEYWYAE